MHHCNDRTTAYFNTEEKENSNVGRLSNEQLRANWVWLW